MKFEPIDLLGIAGASFILFAFYRTSIGRWSGRSIWYELDNLIGGTFMIVYALSKTAYVSILVNAIWVFVAFRGVSSYAERRVIKKAERRVRRAIKNSRHKKHRR